VRALYVTDRWDGPYRYRCRQASEQLRAAGAVGNVLHVDDRRLLSELPRYGVVVLFRLPWSERVAEVVRTARRAGVPVLFDIDDLLFDPSLDQQMPFRRRYGAREWAETYGRQMARLRRTFDEADAFIGSTPELAEHARRLGKTAYVHPNVVPDHYLRLGNVLSKAKAALVSDPTIGYFAGSDTHDEDFASIENALVRVLAERPTAKLLVCGHLGTNARRSELAERVVRLPYMHWKDFAVAYAVCDVTIAPLAVHNAFTDSKSALKFFEAGAFGTPTIATPVREMAAAIAHGETGWLAETEAEWKASLVEALDRERALAVGARAKAAVLARHSSTAVRGELRAILERYAREVRGPAPDPTPLGPPDESGEQRLLKAALRPLGAARDLTRILRAARHEVRPRIDLGRVDRLLDGLLSGSVPPSRSGIFVIGRTELSKFGENAQIAADADLPGEHRSTGSDPHLTSPELALDPSAYRYVVLRLRATASVKIVRAQLFWRGARERKFSETASVSVDIAADGFDGTYVVDLHEPPTRAAWSRARAITHLRLDPMDRPGSFRVDAVAFFPDGSLPDSDDVERSSAVPEAAASGEGLRERLEAALATLGAGERIEVKLSEPPDRVRDVLGEALRYLPLEVERLSLLRGGDTVAILVRRRATSAHGVDIVVPVFNARALTLRCLASVVAHATSDYRLVVIDDASTDPELAPALRAFAATHDRVVHLTNPRNLGFVRTANRGFEHARGRDVLLLNSDTEVFSGFLDGLRAAAYSHPRAGMSSPLSNNATICSVPEFCRRNELPDGMTRAEMAELVSRSSASLHPELVTPHGFCLYVRADFLSEVGPFDAERFGRGFGEENDLGERAKAAGWKTVLADDVYVWHEGKASFGEEGHALEADNGTVLARRHPGYHPAVARFIEENPLEPVQAAVRRHLARRSDRVAPAPLFVLHANPFGASRGGVEYSVGDLVRALALPRAVLAYPEGGGIEVAEVVGGDLGEPLLYRLPLGRMPERFCHEHEEAVRVFDEIVRLFRIGYVHVHHLMFLPLASIRVLAKRRIPYVVTVHDFYPVCPSFNLLDHRTTTLCCPASCGNRERTTACQLALFRHLGESLPPDPAAFVDEHRALYREIFDGAARVLFPSESARRITEQVFRLDPAKTDVVPHGYDGERPAPKNPRRGSPLRVALVGQIAYAAKGARAYLRTMQLLSGENVEWHVFGATELFGFDEALGATVPAPRVVRHGSYDRSSIVRRLREADVDLGVLLPAWPETFSYTLTELLAARVPVVAARTGALADRLEGKSYAILVDDADEAAAAIRTLARDRAMLERMAASVEPPESTMSSAEKHRAVYEACARESPVTGSVSTTRADYRRLNALAVGRAPSEPRAARATRPSPGYANAWWYPHAERMKPYVPESFRQAVRRRLSGDGAKDVIRFRLPGPRARVGAELTLARRYLRTTQLTSHGVDPYLLLDLEPLDPHRVKLLRFNLWCSTHEDAFAQLYFRHAEQRDFDEARSIRVPLQGRLGAWQEYVARLDADSDRRARAWYEGGPIVALRFDPINVPGLLGLGELALCSLDG
jgi:GT2 family glycosyltransferase/glycosyltransferase involved in cell wall biosynthesis